MDLLQILKGTYSVQLCLTAGTSGNFGHLSTTVLRTGNYGKPTGK